MLLPLVDLIIQSLCLLANVLYILSRHVFIVTKMIMVMSMTALVMLKCNENVFCLFSFLLQKKVIYYNLTSFYQTGTLHAQYIHVNVNKTVHVFIVFLCCNVFHGVNS